MGISASWKVCVHLFSVISSPAGPHCTPAGHLLQTRPGRFLLFPDCPQRAPQGAGGSVPADESLAPRAVCRLGAWPPQTPVRICSLTRARVGHLHDEREERERRPGEATAAHVTRETGRRGAHKHLGLPPAPSPPHCSHEAYVCTHTRDVTLSPDTQ